MLLKISIRVEFYNGIVQFLCHSKALLYTLCQRLFKIGKLHILGQR